MSTDLSFYFLLLGIAWVLLVVRTIRHVHAVGGGSVGLPAAMLMAMSFLYGGSFVYAVPGYTHLRAGGSSYLQGYNFSEWLVMQGTFASLLAILGFAIGCGVLMPRKRRAAMVTGQHQVPPRAYEQKMVILLGSIGLVSFGLHFFQVSFPMSDSLIEAGRNVAVVALCLGAYLAKRDGRSIIIWVSLAVLVPLYYLLIFGFVSYGFIFSTILAAFWMAQIRQKRVGLGRFRMALLSVGVVYLLLTMFVGWMSFRDEIRLSAWENVGGSVLSIVQDAILNTELFSPWNFQALDQVNTRLNLPIFIGKMIERHTLHPELQQYGATLIILPLVLLPRFIWSGKPVRGGSDFMEEQTGMMLSDSTTFGTGSVMEFYLNFGYIGVFLGFVVLGWIIRRIDRMAARYLVQGDYFKFARLFLVGIVAIDPLLRPFFIVNGAVFAWIFMTIVGLAMSGRFRRVKYKSRNEISDSVPRQRSPGKSR
uniref:hypothetical protein n=1 Tax=Pararhizobium sp. IMCC3301 TaxID=3067904 RepID=UPI0027415595|nr:hypothetical protein [Pararhizobium sp. IMCC3301]